MKTLEIRFFSLIIAVFGFACLCSQHVFAETNSDNIVRRIQTIKTIDSKKQVDDIEPVSYNVSCTAGKYLASNKRNCSSCPSDFPKSKDGATSVEECYLKCTPPGGEQELPYKKIV